MTFEGCYRAHRGFQERSRAFNVELRASWRFQGVSIASQGLTMSFWGIPGVLEGRFRATEGFKQVQESFKGVPGIWKFQGVSESPGDQRFQEISRAFQEASWAF